MRRFAERRSLRTSALTALILSAITVAVHAADQPNPALRWEGAIGAFEKQDRESKPPEGAILFLGSSSIRMWDLDRYFPDYAKINRGFGGSQISDVLYHFDRLVPPYKSPTIVFYCGDNDIAAGKSPERVLDDYKEFVRRAKEVRRDTNILYIAIKPSIARWNLVGAMREANRLIREFSKGDEHLFFIDIDTPMIGENGRPREGLFLDDGLHLNHEGYVLWTSVLRPTLEELHPHKAGEIVVATCQFPVSDNIAENADWIRRQMRDAEAMGADVAHFPECALSGYAGVDHKTLDDFDFSKQRAELESILDLADQLDLWVVLGATHKLSNGHKPHNALYAITPEGKIADRYDKRFCTGGDLKHYSPGDHFATFEVNGVRCGLLICYDIRFPELYRQYVKQDVDLVFHSFYNARQKPGSIHPKIMPPTAQARAASNGVFISMNNSSAPNSWASLFITPDGLIEERLPLDEPGVMINFVDTEKKYYDASAPYRLRSIDGTWNSGETVDDPRSRDRQGY